MSATFALMAVSLSASAVRAECGDYVRIGSDAMKSPPHSMPMHPHNSPTCHSDPGVPLVPPAPAPIPTSDLYCAVPGVSAAPVSRLDSLLIPNFTLTTQFSSEIFHPPRRLPG